MTAFTARVRRWALVGRIALAILALGVVGTMTAGHLRDHQQPAFGAASSLSVLATHPPKAPMPAQHSPERPSLVQSLCLLAPRAVMALVVGLVLLCLWRCFARRRAQRRIYVNGSMLWRYDRAPPAVLRLPQLSVLRM
ncbi:MAG: hypothetical protein ABJD24_17090 [Acidimicrobiales bacterium]